MSVRNTEEKITAKSPKELSGEYGVHVNTIYNMRNAIATVLNLRKNAKRLSPKQVGIFYGYYGRP